MSVVSSVVVFLVGVAGGFAAGALLVYLCFVRKRLKRPQHPPIPPEDQFYEDMGLTNTQKQLKLSENVAYGQFNQ